MPGFCTSLQAVNMNRSIWVEMPKRTGHCNYRNSASFLSCTGIFALALSHLDNRLAETMDRRSKDGARSCSESLLCHYLFRDGSAQYVFLDLVDEGSAVVNQSLTFCTDTNMHSVVLPQPQITRRSIRTGLAFDGFRYQVVRIFTTEGEKGSIAEASSSSAPPPSAAGSGGGFLEMEILSSETGIWRQHRTLIRLPPDLPKLSTTPLFSNGAIHWELGGYLLIYNVNQGHCRLIELPNFSQIWSLNSMTFGQCLWESEGHVHYCYSDFEGIHAWVLLNEQDLDYYSTYYHYNRDKFQWKLAHTVSHQNLVSRNPEIFLRIRQSNIVFSRWPPFFISPSAYIENSQTMYLRLPGIIASYNLRTQTLREICSFEFPDINFFCCLLFPVVLQGDSQVRKRKPAGDVGNVVSLPITIDALQNPTESN
ncbi:hypothetical protein Q3G72_003230 [Acer saccharum]|nr:hypothetical protein Q3G72_003230 [Acer saccharum]